MTGELVDGLQKAAEQAGVPVEINQIGSMFTVFFTSSRRHKFPDGENVRYNPLRQIFPFNAGARGLFPPITV